jgi:hypothetical protein
MFAAVRRALKGIVLYVNRLDHTFKEEADAERNTQSKRASKGISNQRSAAVEARARTGEVSPIVKSTHT